MREAHRHRHHRGGKHVLDRLIDCGTRYQDCHDDRGEDVLGRHDRTSTKAASAKTPATKPTINIPLQCQFIPSPASSEAAGAALDL